MEFHKIKQLIKTVGGRCLLIEGNDAFVIMGIDEYKKMNLLKGFRDSGNIAEMSEGELLNKINQDIAMWQESQSEDKMADVEEEIMEENDVKIEKVLF